MKALKDKSVSDFGQHAATLGLGHIWLQGSIPPVTIDSISNVRYSMLVSHGELAILLCQYFFSSDFVRPSNSIKALKARVSLRKHAQAYTLGVVQPCGNMTDSSSPCNVE